MNYRHHYHAGNFADVFKHVVLGRLISSLQRKEKGFLYLDTHAGRGRYDLARAQHGETLARTPEWPAGIGRLVGRSDTPVEVGHYLAAVRNFDRRCGNLTDELRFYPGSPWLAKGWLRPQDRMALCELQPSEFAALSSEMGGIPRVSVHPLNGYVAVRSMLPCGEKRALVLIDPPFEDANEWMAIVEAWEDIRARMPACTVAVWYPLTTRARIDAFLSELRSRQLPPTWVAEIAVAGTDSPLKMRGCGLVVVNPPWRLDEEVRRLATWLASALAVAPGAEGGLEWLVSET